MLNNEILLFLSSLDSNNLNYVSWKNNHHIRSIKEIDDIDILIDHKNLNEIKKLALNNNWIFLNNPISFISDIYHLYKIQDGKIYHIHLYSKLLTGTSWLKECYFKNLQRDLLNNRLRFKKFIWIPSIDLQIIIFTLRFIAKNQYLLSKLLFYLENDDYINEYYFILNLINKLNFKKKASYENMSLDTDNFNNFFKIKFQDKEFKKFINKSRRMAGYKIQYFLIAQLVKRFVNKYIFRRNNKKLFTNYGYIIALSGVDGSGKTTLLKKVYELYSNFIVMKKVHMGRPLSNFLNKTVEMNIVKSKAVKDNSLLKNIKPLINNFLKLIMSFYIFRCKKKGYLILSDRWPSKNFNVMDGRKIQGNNTFSLIENFIFKKIEPADIVIYLNVDINSIIRRNNERDSVEKDITDDVVLRYKSSQFKNMKFISKKMITFNNNKFLDSAVNDISNLIWKEICTLEKNKDYC
jgi:thymidylate kinase